MNTPYAHNQAIMAEFRANTGKVGGPFAGKTLLILHTVGAKSGPERVNPVVYVEDGGRLVIVASKGSAPTHPNWYRNLLANPLVTVEVGTQTLQTRASVAAEPERSRLYQKMIAMLPAFAEYEKRTKRIIPVVILTPLK